MPLPIPIVPEVPEAPKEPPTLFEKVMQYRRHYIVKADLEAYGYSPGCPACEETRTGRRRQGVSHTESCLARTEKAAAEDPVRKMILEETDQRFMTRVAADIENMEEKKKEAERAQADAPRAKTARSEASSSNAIVPHSGSESQRNPKREAVELRSARGDRQRSTRSKRRDGGLRAVHSL